MKIETFERTVKVADYVEHYVDVEAFLACCRECPNYDRVWSCPSYDFDPLDYWKQFDELHIVGKKMILQEEEKENYEDLMRQVEDDLTQSLFEEEQKYPGSRSLSAGNCKICGPDNCTKKSGQPCRYPDKLRYSIESLGGNVGLTASKLLGIELLWIEEGQIPDYFVRVGGLLR